MSSSSSRHVALLRSINVGGHNKVPMAELRALCAELGWARVKTYIASGNVAFDAPEGRTPAELAESLRRGIVERFGHTGVPVVVRTAAGVARAVEEVPFEELDDKRVHVVFLDQEPDAERVASLPPDRSPGDEYVVIGDRIYIRYASGAGSSKLTLKWLEKQLGVTGTARNWRTVGKLSELVQA